MNRDFSICLYPSDGGPHSWRYYYTAADAIEKLESYYKNKKEDIEFFEHMSEDLDFPGIVKDDILFIPTQIMDDILKNKVLNIKLLRINNSPDSIYWVNYFDKDYYTSRGWSFLKNFTFKEYLAYGLKQPECTSSFKEKAFKSKNICEFFNSYFKQANEIDTNFNDSNIVLINSKRKSAFYKNLKNDLNKGKPPNEKEYISGKEINLPDSIFIRAKNFLGEAFSILKSKSVLLVGLGTLGSRIAEELIKSGLKNIILYDFDRLEPENICRHICSLNDLGMKKVKAVERHLLAINPFCEIDTYAVNPVDGESLRKFTDNVIHSDLIIVTTGNYESEMFFNKLPTRKKKRVLYCYGNENVDIGEIFFYNPPEGPCYEYLQSNQDPEVNPELAKTFERFKREDKSRDFPGRSYYENAGIPGISVDINFIALLVSKLAISILLDENKEFSGFYSIFPKNKYFFYWNNRGNILNFGIHSQNVFKVPGCNFCSSSGRAVRLLDAKNRNNLQRAIRKYRNRKLDAEKEA